jgi:glycogen operon protein
MLLSGDEMWRTQRGNNNAYCQDSEISWINWELTPEKQRFLEFVRRMIQLRKEHPSFHRRHFFQGRPIRGTEIKDFIWLKPDGGEMTDAEWQQSFARSLGVYFSGAGLKERDRRGRQLSDASFLLLFSAHHELLDFQLPTFAPDTRWTVVMDTSKDDGMASGASYEPAQPYPLQGRSLALLQETQ